MLGSGSSIQCEGLWRQGPGERCKGFLFFFLHASDAHTPRSSRRGRCSAVVACSRPGRSKIRGSAAVCRSHRYRWGRTGSREPGNRWCNPPPSISRTHQGSSKHTLSSTLIRTCSHLQRPTPPCCLSCPHREGKQAPPGNKCLPGTSDTKYWSRGNNTQADTHSRVVSLSAGGSY